MTKRHMLMIPERFEELTKEQRDEFARMGFEIYMAVRRNFSASREMNSTVQRFSEQQRELQKALNSLSQPIHDKLFL